MLNNSSHTPRVVAISAAGDWQQSEGRAPFEIIPAQLPLVQSVLDWLPVPIAYVDRDLNVRFVNETFARRLNHSRAELVDQRASWAGSPASVLRAMQGATVEIHAEWPNAEVLLWLPQRDEGGIVQGCLVVGRQFSGPESAKPLAQTADATAEADAAIAHELKAIIDAMPGPVSIIDAKLRYRHANPAAIAERGMRWTDWTGLTVKELTDPHGWAQIHPLLEKALAGERVDYERDLVAEDGTIRHIARTLYPRRDDSGKTIGIYSFGHDVDAWRAEQAKLAEQRSEVRAFLDAMPLPVAYLDQSRKFVIANQAFASVAGRPFGALIGLTPADVFAGNEQYANIQPYFDHAFSGHTLECEYQWPDSSNNMRWRRVRLVPRRDLDSLPNGLFMIVFDIHEEKVARSLLERRELQVRRFADNIPQPVAYLDPQSRFGFSNRAFANMFDTRQDLIAGQMPSMLFGDDMWSMVAHGHDRALRGQMSVEELLLPLPGSESRWTEVRWLPEYEGPLRVQSRQHLGRGIYLVMLDVHEHRHARSAFERSTEELRRILNSIGTPIAFVNKDRRLMFVNDSLIAWNGSQSETMVGKLVGEVFDPHVYEKFIPHVDRALSGAETVFEREITASDGSRRWTRLRCVPQRNSAGSIDGFYVVIFDVHDLKVQQRELQAKQEELRLANWMLSSHLENSPLAAVELDSDLNIRRWSERAERLFGWRREHVLNRSLWELSLIADGEVDAITRSFALILSSHQQRVSTLQRITRSDGTRIWCEWYVSALSDASGQVASIFALVHDVNQRVEAEARLQQLAAYDALTGLTNRSSLQFELSQALDRARRGDYGVAALFIDLDHFKNVNDTLGHRVGDQLLLAVARILKASVRKGDIVSRMGGDEFMLVIEHASVRSAASQIADKILVALNQPIPVEGHMLTVAASIGIAVFPDHGSDANLLLKNADVAMYHAKELGKGRYEFFSDELAREHEEQSLLEFSLRVAMSSNQLRLLYQPRVSAMDGSIDGAEALLRWRHPELGEIPPQKFIRVAEETGLIFEMGTWVFRKACAQLRDWEMRGLPVKTLSINFSARQLLMRDLVDRISGILTETGCDPKKIEIEITETSMLFDVATTKRVVASLKRLGMRIAIDDFGTGFSSLSHLQQLDIDALKVDQSFVRDLLEDAGDAAITRAVVALGKGIGLQVIAEGVENLQQLLFLRECGCDWYQGYYFSPAISADAFEAMLLANVPDAGPDNHT
jgi:diguanylate cyclase (GGDEF)-like protein/PAS domain S-box-containing protein